MFLNNFVDIIIYHKIHTILICDLMNFSIFLLSCTTITKIWLKALPSSQKVTSCHHFPSYPQPWATTNVVSVSNCLPFLDILYEQYHTIGLASLTECDVFNVYPYCSFYQYFMPFSLSDSSTYTDLCLAYISHFIFTPSKITSNKILLF